MNRGKIISLSKQESGEILLEKSNNNSARHFLSYHIMGWLSLFLKKSYEPTDHILITKNQCICTYNDKIIFQERFSSIKALSYNPIDSSLCLATNHQEMKIPLKVYCISYEESQLIKKKVAYINSNWINTSLE